MTLVAHAQVCEPHWDNAIGQPGMDGNISALAVFDAPGPESGPALYAGGWFTTAGGEGAHRIAQWNGTDWSPLGAGVGGDVGFVRALAVFDDGRGGGAALVAGGFFNEIGDVTAHRIAKWDGSVWSPLGSGMVGDDAVLALKVFDPGSGPMLIAGGAFETAGGEWASHVAKWDGDEWSKLGTGNGHQAGTNDAVLALEVFDDVLGSGSALFLGGEFTEAGGASANHIARWDGTPDGWSPLGDGVNGLVSCMAVFDDGTGPALYVGGAFTQAGGAPANRIARWDGTEWSAVGSGLDGYVGALAVFDDGSGGGPALYAGGSFTSAGNAPANRVAKWDGKAWSALGAGTADHVRALASFENADGPALYVAGAFTEAGGMSSNRIAKWVGCQDQPCPPIPGDLNCDGVVGVADLLILLSMWGPCADCTPGNCPADLTGDCNVGVGDLLILLANWG